jgi:GT2 family glycosyltransferase
METPSKPTEEASRGESADGSPTSRGASATLAESGRHEPVRVAHVAVVVLSYNGRVDTLDCLASVARIRWSALTPILVDNGSRDGTAEAVASRYPAVCVLRQERNLGFAEGNNIGVRRALELGADYVFLLNNDTTIAPDTIRRCVDAASSRPDAGAVCPLIYFAEPSTLVWYAGASFNPYSAHSGRMLGYREVDHGQFGATRETDRAAGAAVLLPSRVLQEVGLLDQALFFLYEDVDWSLRARRAGHRIYVVPEAKVWHRVSATAGGEHAPMIAYYDTRNHVAICRRYAPMGGVAALKREIGILLVHLAGTRRARYWSAYLRAVLQGWIDGRRGRLGPRP